MKVKQSLCGEPLLHTPNFSLLLTLQIDNSNRGAGGRFVPAGRERGQPCAVHQRGTVSDCQLSERQARYSTNVKECLAVSNLRYYLLGHSFTLCSDCAPVQWLHHMRDTKAS